MDTEQHGRALDSVLGEDSMCQEDAAREVYTADIDPSSGRALFGGQNDGAEIYNYRDDYTVTRIEDFSDSVAYTKFLPNGRFLIVTVDGIVALMEHDREVSVLSIGKDVSVCKFSERLVIGTVSGQIYLYDGELEHINTFGGHGSEIVSVDFCEGRVLSMSQGLLIAHDEHGRTLYMLRASCATAFKYIASDVICFAREKKVQIFKATKKLFECAVEDAVESIEYLSGSLVIGGSFEHLLLIDTAGHHATFKLDIGACAMLIKRYDDFKVVFSTSNGLIGLADIRNISTLRYYDPGVDTIFDFAASPDHVCVAGELGFGIVSLHADGTECVS